MKPLNLLKRSKVFLIAIFIFSLLYPSAAFSGGTVKIDSVFVTAFNAYKKMAIYLPQGYNPSGNITYRVVYFLHGVNNNYSTYAWVYPILDSLIGNNLIQPIIMVKPDGAAPPYLGSFYTNSALYGPYEDWIYNYCVQYIDSHYKTKTDQCSRCIMGHSMGGYGTMKMAFKHTNLYRAVASLSGPLDFDVLPMYFPAIIAESGGGPPYNYAPTNGPTSALAFTMCGAFTPNLSNPPYYVSFLLNPQGQMIDSLFKVFKTHCPARLSLNFNSSSNLAIYFDCGLQDELGMLPWNNAFRDTLVARNIPHVYYTYTGNHTNQLGNRVPISLNFLDSVMNTCVSGQMIELLIAKVHNFNIHHGITQALIAKLNSALNALNAGDTMTTCSSLQAFLNFVSAQRGKHIPINQADELTEDAMDIRAALKCTSGMRSANKFEASDYKLKQNYPNPFNPITSIKFDVPKTGFVKLIVYDILGKEVITLVNEKKEPGSYEVSWDATNVASGMYFYKLTAGNYTDTKKMIIMK